MPDEADLLRELEEVQARIGQRREDLAKDEAKRDALVRALVECRRARKTDPPAATPAPPPPRPEELPPPDDPKRRILDAMDEYGEPVSPSDIAEDLSWNLNTVKYHFHHLERAGYIRRVERGLYEIVPPPDQASDAAPQAPGS